MLNECNIKSLSESSELDLNVELNMKQLLRILIPFVIHTSHALAHNCNAIDKLTKSQHITRTAIINKLRGRQDITPTAGTKKTFMTIESDEDIKTFNNKLKEESFFTTVVRQS